MKSEGHRATLGVVLRERFYSFLVGNRWWGLYGGPRPLRSLAAWALPRWVVLLEDDDA